MTKHVPISWSAVSAYKNRSDLTIKNLYFSIVYPYFDHPPLNGRVVLAENLLTPLLLGAIYLFYSFRKNMTFKKTVAIGILCGLAFWTKELGIAVLLSMIYLFISEKIKIKFTSGLIATSLFFVVLYPLYGAYYDWEVFKAVISIQSDRVVGPETLLYI